MPRLAPWPVRGTTQTAGVVCPMRPVLWRRCDSLPTRGDQNLNHWLHDATTSAAVLYTLPGQRLHLVPEPRSAFLLRGYIRSRMREAASTAELERLMIKQIRMPAGHVAQALR